MKPVARISLCLLAWALISKPDVARSEACAPQVFGDIAVTIEGRELIAKMDGKAVARHQLPVVGSAWRCLKMRSFPKQRLLFIEWNGGQAGTSQIFQKVSLLAFSIMPDGVRPRGEWVLRQGYHGDGPERVEADRSWQLEDHEWGVDVLLEGTRRVPLERE